MSKILEKYNSLCSMISDINEHLPIIKKYGEKCEHITEMGTRYIVSTWAFMAAKPKKIVCYDLLTGLDLDFFYKNLDEIKNCAKENSIDLEFHKQNVLEIDIEETDLLFIDTYHEYNQIKKELELHSKKVKKYLIFHDTTTFGQFGETFKEPNTVGIWPAIEEFLKENKEWFIKEKFYNNNGLTILEKQF